MSQPSSGAQRRHRLVTRTLPLGVVAIAAFAIGAATGAPGSPETEAAERFATNWASGDFAAMYRELSPASRAAVKLTEFVGDYRRAAATATLRALEPDTAQAAGSAGDRTIVAVPCVLTTRAFGRFEEDLRLPFAEGGVAWEPRLVFPGLRRGESLESRVRLAKRAPILAADGTALATGPADAREHPLGSAALDVSGETGEASEEELPRLARQGFPPGTPVGVTGLERTFNARLAGRPGGALLAVGSSGSRLLAKAKPRPGVPLKTTIEPDLQTAAVAALAGRQGGIAVLDARNGDVRALAGAAYSAPQPPGSTFKIITTTAALQAGAVSPDSEFELASGVEVGGRLIENDNGELCGGTLAQAFAESCNADFVPLGPKVGSEALVGTAERFGFNAPLTLYAPRYVREAELPESTLPEEIDEEVELGVSAIGQGKVLATPLEMASVAQTVANGGLREPTSIVRARRLRPHARPVRVMSHKVATTLTELMIGVVTEGTGTAGAIAEAQVAAKTGTAELGPKPGEENSPHPEQRKDAWFAAFAPAEHAKLAIGVLLVEAEAAGGEVAAPAAAEVLSAGL